MKLCHICAAGWCDAVAFRGASAAAHNWQPDAQPQPRRPAAHGVCSRAVTDSCSGADMVATLPHGACKSKVLRIVEAVLIGATVVQAPHRRSGSFGGNGFALPGDAADLLRSDLVTSKVKFELRL